MKKEKTEWTTDNFRDPQTKERVTTGQGGVKLITEYDPTPNEQPIKGPGGIPNRVIGRPEMHRRLRNEDQKKGD
jgi:hypothetical protein